MSVMSWYIYHCIELIVWVWDGLAPMPSTHSIIFLTVVWCVYVLCLTHQRSDVFTWKAKKKKEKKKRGCSIFQSWDSRVICLISFFLWVLLCDYGWGNEKKNFSFVVHVLKYFQKENIWLCNHHLVTNILLISNFVFYFQKGINTKYLF
jgi:hypothetical protein